MNMNSGYSGYSKSNRAMDAEEEGKYPLTKASRFLRSKLIEKLDIKIKIKEAKKILEQYWDGEWHHSSKYCNKVNYYDVINTFGLIKYEIENGIFLENIDDFCDGELIIYNCDECGSFAYDLFKKIDCKVSGFLEQKVIESHSLFEEENYLNYQQKNIA